MNLLRNSWNEFVSHPATRPLSVASLILYAVLLIGFWLLESRLSPQIPLFYSLPKGAEQLGTVVNIKQLLVSTGLLLIIDFAVAIILARSWITLTLIMLWSAFMLVTLLSITLLRIYLLVT